MRYFTTLLAALPLLVSARPIRRSVSANDALVLKFANLLENLETQFYAQGLAKFQSSDFSDAGFTSPEMVTEILTSIHLDESTHETFLEQALMDNGATPLMCDFDFSSALTDVATMAATARVVEMVGVSAYLGGATLIDDPLILDAAASILTVEARHSLLLNLMSGEGSALPQAFDIPFTPQEVLSIAGGFIKGSCDTGLTPTNPLSLTNSGTVTVGTLLTFSASGMSSTDGLFCNMLTGGMPFALNLPLSQCYVPEGINGPVAIWITSDNNPLANNVIDRDTTKQIAGPLIAFIDTAPELLSQLVRGSGTNSGATTTTTTTITPGEAASIIAGASATATASDSSSTSGSDSSSSSPSDSSSGSDGVASVPASTPLPTDFTGTSPDGKVSVNGLSMVPRPTDLPTASGSAAVASVTSSASDDSAGSASDSAASTSDSAASASTSSS